jgi:anaerobic selenocysteine-containing dehydrogenase
MEVSVAAPTRVIGRQLRVEPDGTRVHLKQCPLCECMCGMEIHLDPDDKVKVIRPDKDDVWSTGYICPKGTTLGKLHEDPDRIRVPMIREGDTWREASWPEAFARCEELLHGVRDRHGIEAMTAFIGNPAGHSFSIGRYGALLMGQANFPMIYSAGTVDQWPKNVSCVLMYGNMWKIPTVDIRRTDYWVIMGGNPQASGGSLLSCPDVLGEIDAIRERGGKVIVIDPRRTGTADRATEWLPIRPGADAAFLLALCNVIFDEGLLDLGPIAHMVNGVDEMRAAADGFTPEAVADFCRIPADTIRRIAHELAGAERGALYGRIGLCNQEFGTLASWLVDVVNILTGHFDVEGGMMFGKPVTEPLTWKGDTRVMGEPEFGRWTSRVRGAPEVLGQVPCSCLAEEIATPGEGQLKALITIAGNPVISAPDSAQLEEALPLLECMISIDNYMNETTRFAHVILPGPSPLESPHIDELMWGWAVGSAAKWSDQLFDTLEGYTPEWEILARLGWYCTGGTEEAFDFQALDDGWFTTLCHMYGRDPEATLPLYDHGGPERMIDLQVRMGPWGDRYGEVPDGLTLQTIKDATHGIDLGPMVPRLDEVIGTPSGKVELAPPYIVGDLPRLRDALDRDPDGYVLVSRRHIRSKNSWMHNVKVLVKGKDRCTLIVHPDDATELGLVDGEKARVASEAGSIEVPVEVSDEMMRGVVSLPHGWGHDRPGTRLSVAREHAGVNSNLLSPGHFVDELSGNAAVNGIPVEVSPAVPA